LASVPASTPFINPSHKLVVILLSGVGPKVVVPSGQCVRLFLLAKTKRVRAVGRTEAVTYVKQRGPEPLDYLDSKPISVAREKIPFVFNGLQGSIF